MQNKAQTTTIIITGAAREIETRLPQRETATAVCERDGTMPLEKVNKVKQLKLKLVGERKN